jgi:hypothetical protein
MNVTRLAVPTRTIRLQDVNFPPLERMCRPVIVLALIVTEHNYRCFSDRKLSAIRAYHEWVPIRQVALDDKLRIWRNFQVGKLLVGFFESVRSCIKLFENRI